MTVKFCCKFSQGVSQPPDSIAFEQFEFRNRPYQGHVYVQDDFKEALKGDKQFRSTVREAVQAILFLHETQLDNCYLRSCGDIEMITHERIYFKHYSLTHEIDLAAISIGSGKLEIWERIDEIYNSYRPLLTKTSLTPLSQETMKIKDLFKIFEEHKKTEQKKVNHLEGFLDCPQKKNDKPIEEIEYSLDKKIAFLTALMSRLNETKKKA